MLREIYLTDLIACTAALRYLNTLRSLFLPENYLEGLPEWFAPVSDLQSSLRVLDVSRQRNTALAEWLCSKGSCLPCGLQQLSIADIGLTQMPIEAIQTSCRLHTLDISMNRHMSTSQVDWKHILPRLMRFNTARSPCWIAGLCQLHLCELSVSNLSTSDTEVLCSEISWLSMSETLISLSFNISVLPEVPIALRALRKLQFLSLSAWFKLSRLPDWLCHLPLEEINLSFCTELIALPVAMSCCHALRVVDVQHCYMLHDFAFTSTDANPESLNELAYEFKINFGAGHANQVWYIMRPDLMWNVEHGFRNLELEMQWTPEPFTMRA